MEANWHFTAGYLASFAHNLPPQIEVEDRWYSWDLAAVLLFPGGSFQN